MFSGIPHLLDDDDAEDENDDENDDKHNNDDALKKQLSMLLCYHNDHCSLFGISIRMNILCCWVLFVLCDSMRHPRCPYGFGCFASSVLESFLRCSLNIQVWTIQATDSAQVVFHLVWARLKQFWQNSRTRTCILKRQRPKPLPRCRSCRPGCSFISWWRKLTLIIGID